MTQHSATTSANLYAAIDAVATAQGPKPCWIVPGRGSWSFDDLRAQSARQAAALRAAGLRPGDRLLLQAEKSPEFVLLWLGCLRAGAVFIPLNTAYTAAEVRYFALDSRPRLLVCDPKQAATLAPVAAECGARLHTLDAQGGGSWSDAVAALPAVTAHANCEPCGADDLAAILYTSGTTGRSKGAMLSHGNLESNARTLVELWRFTADDVLLHALPIYHVHGLFIATHCALLAGASTLLLPRFDVAAVMAQLPRTTAFMGIPTYYVRLLDEPTFGRDTASHLRVYICGSAPLLPATFAQFEQRTGQRILERYGMTEAGMITSNPYDGERVAGSVGFALPGVSVRVAGPDGTELPQGEPGVLEIRGPNLFKGYWQMPEKTAEEFRADGYFITGDVVTQDADGRIAIVGRAKDLVISGGFNIYPKEIELQIDALPEVVESAVIGVPHPDFGEGVVAVVVRRSGATLDEAQVQAALHERLARFKQPKRVFFVDGLPRNAMGKVQKARLREQYAMTFGGG
ncbi:MAG: malonyl-CoA synthase [Steroidobacteraceae bacterium]|nr:malonyl-CoA synthase [Nevskiaceae bacterium]MCP5339962.1 malonyl-CoA synthase [Nevskiaceae bacterium]